MAEPDRRIPRRAFPLAGLVVAAALTACGDDGGTAGAEVESIESILASEIEIIVDPSATSAVLEVDTSIPVACSVVYGTDDSFGSIAVDNDMQGGAHEDHRPVLGGLQPETEYRYVLQGADAAGTLYRSEVMTFTTPAASVDPAVDNVAPLGTATASSEFSDQFSADRAIDGDLSTEWSSAGDGDDAWIEVELGEPMEVTGVAFRTRQMSDGSSIVETFTVAFDGGDPVGPFTVADGPVELAEPVPARVVRFDAAGTTGGNTGAVEVEVHTRP